MLVVGSENCQMKAILSHQEPANHFQIVKLAAGAICPAKMLCIPIVLIQIDHIRKLQGFLLMDSPEIVAGIVVAARCTILAKQLLVNTVQREENDLYQMNWMVKQWKEDAVGTTLIQMQKCPISTEVSILIFSTHSLPVLSPSPPSFNLIVPFSISPAALSLFPL